MVDKDTREDTKENCEMGLETGGKGNRRLSVMSYRLRVTILSDSRAPNLSALPDLRLPLPHRHHLHLPMSFLPSWTETLLILHSPVPPLPSSWESFPHHHPTLISFSGNSASTHSISRLSAHGFLFILSVCFVDLDEGHGP